MKYTIQPGYSFVDDDGKVRTGGEIIGVSEDVARAHPEKLVPVQDESSTDAAAGTDAQAHAAE